MAEHATSECPGTGKTGRDVRRSDVRANCPVCHQLVRLTERGFYGRLLSHTAATQTIRQPEPAVIRQPRAIVSAAPKPADDHRCYVCGWPAEMRNSLGPTCAEHYDNDGG